MLSASLMEINCRVTSLEWVRHFFTGILMIKKFLPLQILNIDIFKEIKLP